MKIVIPMSGVGARFQRAGYRLPKPLIEVDGKPIIGHVVDMFPGETDLLFVCNREHLETPAFRLRETLAEIAPTAEIAAIEPHKLGPVHAVLQVAERLPAGEPVIVNYCDFTCYWDYGHFKRFVAESGCDGAIACYRGFHPHMLGSVNYAYVPERDGWATDIAEKRPFTDDPMSEFASSGTYYFASGELLLDAFRRTVAQDLQVGGEYYVSLAYKPLFADRRRVAVYELQHFMQWGTPEDLAEYRHWSALFAALPHEAADEGDRRGTVLIPMAGEGRRFADEGYAAPKPLIPVSGKPMVLQAAQDLPPARRYVFVARRQQVGLETLQAALESALPRPEMVLLDGMTRGQAETCLAGLAEVDDDESITVGACDNGLLYDRAAFRALLEDGEADVVVWVVRGHPPAARRPEMYGWVEAEGDRVRRVSVKVPLAAPAEDPVVIGAFSFRRAGDFRRAVERLIAEDDRVKGEFYVDSAINHALALGLDCRIFEIDHYLGWGTPGELRTFEYWQSCFHKWPSHPYRLERDPNLAPAALAELERRYAATRPALPETVS